ncbi:MAG: radical SAM protein, partial [Chloroflexi bacterium]|nr:radical SAM protein [Chloroflexota bacterium]
EIVSWNTTQRCNLRCSHCYLAAGESAAAELSFEEGCRLIDELAAAGTQMLILTGGEPLMRRDIAKLAAHASGRGLLAVVGTNGMLLSPRLIRELKEAGVGGAGISLDSLDPAKHDAFRGVQGAWEGTVRGIRLCAAEELPVLLQMTVLPWNYGEVEELMEFAHHEGATAFNLYFLVCTGRAERLSDITPQQHEQVLGSLLKAQWRYPQMMVRARCAPQISRVASLGGSALIGNAGCLAARQYCRIAPEGDVTPCPYLPLVAGNVRQQHFVDIWRYAPPFRKLRGGPLTGRCGTCHFRPVCGGCRARAFAVTGDILAEDPWCVYEPANHGPTRDAGALRWTPEAEQRLQRIPPFIRQRVKVAVERYAAANQEQEVSPAVMTATLGSLGRAAPFRRPPSAKAAESASPTEGKPSRS